VDTVFGVPGESFLSALDGMFELRGQIRFVSCRQEGGAAFMAEAWGKLTGRPGVCMVTRGPGATNAAIGLHTAFQDSTPLLLFIGQVGREFLDREAFQEIDYRRMFGPVTKWVAQIDLAARIDEYVDRAVHVACSGRPGPVVLALPEDMLSELALPLEMPPMRPSARCAPAPGDLAAAAAMLATASRPLVLLGGSGWTAADLQRLQRFANHWQLPVGTSFRRQDLIDNRHQCYAGDVGIGIAPYLAEDVRKADLLLVLGARVDEMTTSGYALLESPRSRQRLLHMAASADLLNTTHQADLAIQATPAEMAAALEQLQPPSQIPWAARTAYLHAQWKAHVAPDQPIDGLHLGRFFAHLRRVLPDDAIVTNGAGNYAAWLHRHFEYRGYPTQLAPQSGAMGYGVPAAVAAALAHPERIVVSVSGDGCFMMNGQELATAAQHGLRILFIVVNNSRYGTIRMHQEREFPGRVMGTDLVNPNFVALGSAYGLHAERVTRNEGVEKALRRCLDCAGSSLLEVVPDSHWLSPRARVAA
jgi:acetolactate synthase-1/2/3 large subunit